MDKYEFNIKVEQIKKMVNKSDYETAMKIADTIDWKRVRNANLLSMIAQVYEKNDEYQAAKDILLLAFERAPIGKRLLYKLTELAIKEGNIPEAEAYYREFCDLAPDDPRQHLLRYLILKAKGAPSEQLVHSLERYTDIELEEKWLYELAELYCQVGNKQDCIKMCDRITLMFGLGKYVDKAMELKQKYAPLTPYQMSLVENRDKYESNLRNVEQQFEQTAYTQTGDEFDEAPVIHPMDEDLVAHLHQAEAEESLAKEMSRISIDDYVEDSPLGATRVIPEIKNIRNFRPDMNAGVPPYSPNSQYNPNGQYNQNGQYINNTAYMGNQQPYGGYPQADPAAYNNQPVQNDPYTGNHPYTDNNQYGYKSLDELSAQQGYGAQANYNQQPYAESVPINSYPGYNDLNANPGYGTPQNPNNQAGNPNLYNTGGQPGYGFSPQFSQGNPKPDYNMPARQNMGTDYNALDNPQHQVGQTNNYEENSTENTANRYYMDGQGEFTEFAYEEDTAGSENRLPNQPHTGEITNQTVSQNTGAQDNRNGYVINTQAGFANHYAVKEQSVPDNKAAENQMTLQELQDAKVQENPYESSYAAGLNSQSFPDWSAGNQTQEIPDSQEAEVADAVPLCVQSDIEGKNQPKPVEAPKTEQPPLSGMQTVSDSQVNLNGVPETDIGRHPIEPMADQPLSDTSAEGSNSAETLESFEFTDASHNMNINPAANFTNENLLSNQPNTFGVQDTEHVNILEMQQDLRTRLAPDAMMPQPEMQYTPQENIHAVKPPYNKTDNVIGSSDYLQRQYNAGKSMNGVPVNEKQPAPASRPEYPDQEIYSNNQIPNHIMIEARTPEKGFDIAIEVLKQIHKEMGTKNQVVKISGGKLSHKGIFAVANKLAGKDLIVEEAGDLTPQALDELNQMMEADTTGMIVVLIDNPRQLEELHHNYPVLARRFECIGSGEETVDEVERAIAKQIDVQESIAKEVIPRQPVKPQPPERPVERNTASAMAAFREEKEQQSTILRPVATGQSEAYMQQVKHIQMPDSADDTEELELEEFAQYACRYASEIDCSITGKSKLALYERIEIMEEDGIPLTRANAEALIEEAADKAEKPSLGKLITGVFSSKYDKEGLLILKEHHFID